MSSTHVCTSLSKLSFTLICCTVTSITNLRLEMNRDWKDSSDGKKRSVRREPAIGVAPEWWRVVCNSEERTEIKLFQITSHNLLQKHSHPFSHKGVHFMRHPFFTHGSHAPVKGLVMWFISRDYCTHCPQLLFDIGTAVQNYMKASGFWAISYCIPVVQLVHSD